MSTLIKILTASILYPELNQDKIALLTGVPKSKISRILSGEISPDNLELVDELHMEFPVVDALFTGDSCPVTPLKITGDASEKLRLADILYQAARQSHGVEAVRIYRDAIRLDLDASVDMSSLSEDGRIWVMEERLQAIQSLLPSLPGMVPDSMRRAVELGVEQNNAAVQFLLDKYHAGKNGVIAALSPDSESIALYDALFHKCLQEKMTGQNDLVRRTVKLYSGINYIEVLIEAGLTDRACQAYKSLVESFSTQKQVSIGRLLYFNSWSHNRDAIRGLIKPRVVAA